MKSSANGFPLAEGSAELLGERIWGCPLKSSANSFGEILGERFWGNFQGNPQVLVKFPRKTTKFWGTFQGNPLSWGNVQGNPLSFGEISRETL